MRGCLAHARTSASAQRRKRRETFTRGCYDFLDERRRGPQNDWVGRYGGLAKHHLSEAEKAALEASDYAAVTPAGPPSGAVAYPYYTTRGPRDFLAKCPPSIGP